MKMNNKLTEIHKAALTNLTKNALNYYESGADYEQTLSDNKFAYSRYKIYPHILKNSLNNVAYDVDLSTQAFGKTFKSPIFIAPTAMQKMAHKDGEIGSASGKGLKYIIYMFFMFFLSFSNIFTM